MKRWRTDELRHCHYCQRPLTTEMVDGPFGKMPGGPATRDHLIPRAQGGALLRDNVVPACHRCNREKGNRTPLQWQDRWYYHNSMYLAHEKKLREAA